MEAMTLPMILPARLRRHPWEMPWRLLVFLWAFRVCVFMWLWKINGATFFGASQSLTVQALFDVLAWAYRRQHTPPVPWASEDERRERGGTFVSPANVLPPPPPPPPPPTPRPARAPWMRRYDHNTGPEDC